MRLKCKLKAILADREIKHKDFSISVGLSTAALSRIVSGRSIPHLDTALMIADVLGLKVEEIWVKVE